MLAFVCFFGISLLTGYAVAAWWDFVESWDQKTP